MVTCAGYLSLADGFITLKIINFHQYFVFSAFIFDWSGTLSDDFDMVYNATRMVIAELDGGYVLSEDEYRRYFELPYMNFYRNYGLGVTKEKVDELFFRFVKENGIFPKPFPSAQSVLECLKAGGKKIYLFSAHPVEMVARELEAYGFGELFDGVESGIIDKVASLNGFVEKNGLKPQEAVYAGDLVHDVEAAKEAGIKSVGIYSRYQHKEKLEAAKPDYIIEELEELLLL